MGVFARNSLRVAGLALGAAVLMLSPEPPQATAQEPSQPTELAPPPRIVNWVSEDTYAHTAIGAVLKANKNRVPATGKELMEALRKFGDVAQLPVTFSAVALDSGLTNPRVVIAPREPEKVKPAPPAPGSAEKKLEKQPEPKPTDASRLEGRLFFAANMERGTNPREVHVKTIEFISWNSRHKRFDFGVIECDGEASRLQILDGVRCFTCHKNKGPILGQGPWSNTTHNDVVRTAALSAFDPKMFPASESPWMNSSRVAKVIPPLSPLTPAVKAKTTFDGISLVAGEPEACDATIRRGGDLVRDREIYRALTKTPDGRQAFILLLAEIANPPHEQNSSSEGSDFGSGWSGRPSRPPPLSVASSSGGNEAAKPPIDLTPLKVKQAINLTFNVNSVSFAYEVVAINKSQSSTLFDYSPAGSMGTMRAVTTTGTPQMAVVWSGDPIAVAGYNSRRQAGEQNVQSNRQPSNPKAFVRSTIPIPPKPSDAINVRSLANLMGVTEADRNFTRDHLEFLAREIGKSHVTAAVLAREVCSSKPFSDVLRAYEVPAREEFKDLFVAGLAEVALKYKISRRVKPARESYASGPSVALSAGQFEKEIALVPTTSCLGCHDISGAGKRGFNPIPKLAFDPFDKSAREMWAKQTDKKKKQEILGRMLKRIGTDKDMPPEDSAEYQMFREKNQPAFDAIKDWLEAELAKAKI